MQALADGPEKRQEAPPGPLPRNNGPSWFIFEKRLAGNLSRNFGFIHSLSFDEKLLQKQFQGHIVIEDSMNSRYKLSMTKHNTVDT